METKTRERSQMLLVLIGAAIPTLFILNKYLNLSEEILILVVTVLGLIFASLALWIYATRQTDGTEWWQDDEASGWRGY